MIPKGARLARARRGSRREGPPVARLSIERDSSQASSASCFVRPPGFSRSTSPTTISRSRGAFDRAGADVVSRKREHLMDRRQLLCLLTAFLLPACSRDEDSRAGSGASGGDGTKGTIAVSLLTLDNPFFKVIGDTITEEARKHGYATLVVSGDNDVAKQQNQVKDFIVQGAAAIVLSPCDSKA